ncbi:MAG: nucleotidyltransferase family protein [Hyphomicrobiaceae bacterium]
MGISLEKAFVLAAGLGTRMRPLTEHVPKPLVRLAGRALLDHVLDRIEDARIADAVVNVHYLADMVEQHLASRIMPHITISDERDELLDTGGGVAKALPLLGDGPFLVHNSDSVWIERATANLPALGAAFDERRMDGLLLVADRITSLGYDGRGDFHLEADGRLRRVARGETAEFVFAGVSIATPRLIRDAPAAAFSLNRVWDRALAEQRLFGLRLDGTWMHVGDPAALSAAEARLAGHATGAEKSR